MYKPRTQSTHYDVQLQLTAYKPALIWLNNGLITGKWPGFNETSTLQATNLMSRCQDTLSDTCTTYYCHSHWHTVCILIGWHVHHDVRGLSSSTPTAYLTIVVYTYWFPRIIHYGKIHLSYYQSTVYGRAIKISIFPPIFGCISEMIQKRHSYCDVVCQIIAAVMSVSDFNVIQLLQTSKSSISEHYLAYVKYSAVTGK